MYGSDWSCCGSAGVATARAAGRRRRARQSRSTRPGTELPRSPSIVIDATQKGQPISKYIYGQFIEHLGRCIYGGIWAEMLEDRKFYYPITPTMLRTAPRTPRTSPLPVVDRFALAGASGGPDSVHDGQRRVRLSASTARGSAREAAFGRTTWRS